MVLSIDFGGAVAKVLIVDEDRFEVVEVPLGFRTRPHFKVIDALRYVIKQTVGGRKPDAIYASGEIASVELKEILTKPPVDPVETLEKLELPLVVVGSGITYANGEAVRRADVVGHAEEIAHFLPFEVRLSEIQNYFANKKLYPQTVPTTPRDIMLEQAAARVRIRSIFNFQFSIFNSDYIIASGGVFAKAPEPGQVILMLLDALEPSGVLRIYLDQKQILPALATLAFYEEETAQKILDQRPFNFLGTAFSIPEGVSLSLDLGLSEPQELEVNQEELVLFPLEPQKVVRIKFASRSQKGEFEAEGGEVGLIVDTRRRPLALPKSESERIRVLKEWEEAVCSARLFKK